MLWWTLCALLACACAAPADNAPCGYDSCPKFEAKLLNIHIVPHTHDDVGWLKTVDQYYYGSRNYIQKAGVQYILDSVIDELWKDESRRFIYVETAFFWKWWTNQKESIKQKVHKMVRQGRLEFIGGAWSMNDEATTRYQSTIDQFTWGLRKLNDTFGECGRPRVGWQIDPFGHSRELASLLADMGYDGLFHGRIDYQDKQQRLANKTMEMLWRGNDDLGAASDIFTGVLYNTYSPPSGFCFDVLCSDEPIIDDVDSPMYNVERRVEEFLKYVAEQSKCYVSNNALVTMGGDFTYQHAEMWYKNLDLLIRYANLKAAKDKLNMKLFYSTPSCYLKAVHDANPSLPTKRDDFMPYASDAHSYWSGYFTSRPSIKFFERRGNAYLQMVKQLQVLADLEEHNMFLINELRSAMGIMQHHDAVTGTEKQHVANDYSRILHLAVEDAVLVLGQAFSKLMEGAPQNATDLRLTRCQLNISQCEPTEMNDQFVVTIYNPLAWPVTDAIRLPVRHANHTVYDSKGYEVPSQVVQVPAPLVLVPTRHSATRSELVFAAAVPPLGYISYFVRHATKRSKRSTYYSGELSRQDKLAINTIAHYLSRPYDMSPAIKRHSVDEPREGDYTEWSDASASQFNLDTMSEQQIRQILEDNEKSLKKFAPTEKRDADESKQHGGVNYISLSALSSGSSADLMQTVQVYSDDDFIENGRLRVSVDRATGALTSLASDGVSTPLRVEVLSYAGWLGDNEMAAKRSSGAYIFRPNGTATLLPLRNTTKIIKGPIVQEIHQEYSDFASAVIRLYNHSRFLEVEWLVGPIPIEDKIGKEIVFRYSTNLSNNQIFYTDSNGKQSLKRTFNQRPQYKLSVHEAVAGNYYPINSKIHIEDAAQQLRLSVLNDRAQGGSSLNEGQIELMVHRRLLHDDAFGVGEALNETAEGYGLVARGKHYIHFGKISDELKQIEKVTAVEIVQPLEVLVSNRTDLVFDDWKWLKNDWSALKTELPKGVNLLTLEPWRKGEILMRLENIFEKDDEDGKKTVDVSKMLDSIEMKWIEEVSLAANQYRKDRKRFEWKTQDFGNEKESQRVPSGFSVDLKPSQIRTFIVGYEFKKNAKED